AMAMSWGEHWLPGGAAGANGVPYDNGPGRCANADQDDYTDVLPPHVPSAFDCSSFVSRCYGVIGWAGPHIRSPLYVGPRSVSDDYLRAADGHAQAWQSKWLKTNTPLKGTYPNLGKNSGNDPFNKWISAGDVVVRGGSGNDGHIAFVHHVTSDANGYATQY